MLKPIIRISRRSLRAVALAALLVPAALFLIFWMKPIFSVPCVLAIAAAFFLYLRLVPSSRERDAFGETDAHFCLSPLVLLAVVCCAALWTFFSGLGGCFYQNEDHFGRNAIFHDLLEHAWPVRFEGTPFALTYYIGYWIVPALLGKAAAALLGEGALWGAANAALFLETVFFLVLIFLLLLSLLRATKLLPVCLSLLAFVLFSGMDALMASFNAEAWQHQAEWWAGAYQYSSMTTCLFWVFNQAVPAWLATLVFLSRPEDIGSFALLGLAAMPFSPFPFVGLFVFFIGMALFMLAKSLRAHGASGAGALLRRCLTGRNLLACAGIAPAFCLYFMANAASGNAPLRFQPYAYAYGALPAFMRLLLFALVEFGAYSLLIGSRFARDPLFWLAQLSLLLIPVFKMGYNMDFSMRASIPGLTLMAVYVIFYLNESFERRAHRLTACALVLLLAIGAITPMREFERGAYKVREAGTIFLAADPFGTVLHPDADTLNFICQDTESAFFYRHLAR